MFDCGCPCVIACAFVLLFCGVCLFVHVCGVFVLVELVLWLVCVWL